VDKDMNCMLSMLKGASFMIVAQGQFPSASSLVCSSPSFERLRSKGIASQQHPLSSSGLIQEQKAPSKNTCESVKRKHETAASLSSGGFFGVCVGWTTNKKLPHPES